MTWCQIETIEGKAEYRFHKAEYRFYIAVKNIDGRTFIVAAAKDVADRNNPFKPRFDTANDFEWMYDVLSCLAEKFKKKFPGANVRVGSVEYGNVNL